MSKFDLPESITTWSVDAVELSDINGMCVAESHSFTVFKYYFIKLRLPYKAVRGMCRPVEYKDECTAFGNHSCQRHVYNCIIWTLIETIKVVNTLKGLTVQCRNEFTDFKVIKIVRDMFANIN